MADEIDASVNLVKPARADTGCDLLRAQPELEQLLAGDDAVLQPGERRDQPICARRDVHNSPGDGANELRGELGPYTGHKRPAAWRLDVVGELCT